MQSECIFLLLKLLEMSFVYINVYNKCCVFLLIWEIFDRQLFFIIKLGSSFSFQFYDFMTYSGDFLF